ncbi:MAG: methyltransferase domain-containing protein [Sedimentisphaerales bacterium]|nr:methyltransferase domain-containing protein [Sedimentisphaerales bacterium]
MPEKEPTVSYDAHATRRYERIHGEIFNPVEQQRLHDSLRRAVATIQTGSQPLTALDYGCGSGNLTRHLIDLGLQTVSADVSEHFLRLIEKDFSRSGLSSTLQINGADLSGVQDCHFDLVATYSVLHHVPDYLHIVAEMCRVVKPGGVVYIDHEATEAYYSRPAEYVEFLRKAQPRVNWRRYLRLLFDVPGYVHIVRRLLNPRYKREGDIHVWPDDHIEWDKIERVLTERGWEVVLKQDYLLCRSLYDPAVYSQYKDRCSDQRVLIARKRQDPHGL